MFTKIFKIDQAPDDGANAGGGQGSQAGAAGAAVADGAGAGAQAGADPNAANQNAGKGAGASSAEEQFEMEFDGQKGKFTRQQIIDALRKDKDYTQKTQELAKTRKEQLTRLARLEQMETELQERIKKGGKTEDGEGGEGEGDEDPVKTLKGRLDMLHEKELQRDWKDAYNPVATKYPDMNEDRLIDRFLEKKKLGEVGDNAEGLMKTAAEVAAEIKTETDTAENKRVEKLLANPDDTRLAAFKQKVIADFKAGKIKLANAGGDSGAGAGAGHGETEKDGDLSDVAKKIRERTKE